MDKNSNDSTDTRAVEAAEELVISLLEQDVSAPDISFALAFVATDLGLQMAPSAEHAIAVVTDAIRQIATNHAFADTQVGNNANDCSGDDVAAINPEVFGRTVH